MGVYSLLFYISSVLRNAARMIRAGWSGSDRPPAGSAMMRLAALGGPLKRGAAPEGAVVRLSFRSVKVAKAIPVSTPRESAGRTTACGV